MQRGVSAAAAADLIQEAFLRLLRVPRGEVRDLRSYLFRMAGNLVIDDVRHRRRTGAFIDVEAVEDQLVDPAPLPDAALISREEFRALEEALTALPPRCREVLILHKFEGLTYAEIAERLGITKNTVMAHMVKGVSCLKGRVREISSQSD
jgi:RNA polymerase sigma-70 factor (ECF subfamily)